MLHAVHTVLHLGLTAVNTSPTCWASLVKKKKQYIKKKIIINLQPRPARPQTTTAKKPKDVFMFDKTHCQKHVPVVQCAPLSGVHCLFQTFNAGCKVVLLVSGTVGPASWLHNTQCLNIKGWTEQTKCLVCVQFNGCLSVLYLWVLTICVLFL